ncbi:unnamed protein product, partial [Mesorhabditis belari]|uniref:Uncharacterized protein n=1 Tax=Mesorhabditis belari TaxID=2138241 RepID=A0AAF3EAT5_9BILA
MASSSENGIPAAPPTPQKSLNTQERLFGDNMPTTPKKITPTFKSSIFETEAPPSPQRTPKKVIRTIERNPITGEVKKQQKVAA